MTIKVLFFAEFREIFGPERLIQAEEGSTVGKILDIFSDESREFSLKKESLICAVNENVETIEKELSDQDHLAIMTPMSGG